MSLPKPSNQAPIVVTGASSGIGTELAGGLARRGYPLVLVARRRERLDELADELRSQYSVGVDVMPLDLGDAGSRKQLAERLRSEPIAGLCNSAGFGSSGVFQTLPIERESEEVVLNSLALMELTHAALPGMVERGAGAVLNIASIAGFQPMPFMAVYSATKAFVQTFSEAVHEELHGTGVSVTVLCPGPVPTEWGEIASAERFSIPLAQVSPHDVAYNGWGAPAILSSSNSTFDLDSGYFSAAWNNGLSVRILGYTSGILTHDLTFTVNTSGPTLEKLDFLGVNEQLFDRVSVERTKHQHARTRQQCRVELERWILGRGPDQHHGAVFHHGEK